ncbi:MAG: hypothetical protein KF775_08095 [Cyclobacteriaceae bacterium]|nr:hypothetical protein [Cyclobacteriaceae bacterium]
MILLFCFIGENSFAQDKRPINNKSTIRQTKAKSVKHKEKATTKDLAGYKLRTANQSTAKRAVHSSTSPYKATRRAGDQAGKPIGGRPAGIRSRTAEAGRANIYPQKGPFVNHNSKSPERAYNNRQQLSRLARLQTRHDPPGGKKRVTPRSNSQAYVTRGRKNVYWGKYSKGERAFTTDLAGRPLRTKNFRTPANPLMKAGNPYYGRKDRGDRAYKGTFRSGYATASKRGEQAWRGDISGQPIRRSAGRPNQVAGQRGDSPRIKPGFSARLLKKDVGRISGIKSKKGGGSVTGLFQSNKPLPPRQPGDGGQFMKRDFARLKGIKPQKGGGSVTGKIQSNTPLPPRQPGSGANYMKRDFARLKGIKPNKGGGSVTGKYNSNQPLTPRAPGVGANFIRRDLNRLQGVKPVKGGGSISGLRRNNNNMPIAVRQPVDQRAARFQVNYKGFIPQNRASRNFSQEGLSYTGNIKSARPQKGGGSVSGTLWNNKGQPLPPKYSAGAPAKFQGNLQQGPKQLSRLGYDYQGNIPRQKKSFSREGYDWAGNARASKPLKGGGSVSGQLWNNKGQPLPAKYSASAASKFQGNLVGTRKSFSREGYDWAGYDRTRKPEKGGGSVSGQLWNNKGQPLPARVPTGKQAGEVGYSGKIKLPLLKREYVRNPNAVKEALKKHSPYENVYQVNNVTTPLKQRETGKNRLSAKAALPGLPPGRGTAKAGEYSGTMKQYWEYKHNPSSANAALKTIKYSKAFAQATEFEGKVRLARDYRHAPLANKNALKVLAPGRAYARIGDYQGNVRMNKYNHQKHFPDASFAHGKDNNAKGQRTIFTNVKLFWSGLFKRQSTQPDAVKEKVRKPRYDKKEKELWKDLYD